MILGTRHTGLVVRDLEQSLGFYRDLLGLPVWQRRVEEGDFIDKVVGIPGVKLEWAKLFLPDGSLLELLQYHSHPETGPRSPYPANRHGCSHVALTVGDLETLFQTLQAHGVTCNSPPQVSPDGRVRVLYCHDPDGINLELVEEIKTEISTV
jgi:catechol 2,3-dioxygenase-like lactoylglutathione lyase family enzyme